jgi:hypothetical protein
MNPSSQAPTADVPNLATVVVNVLGDLAFMVTDDGPGELPGGTVWMCGEISFRGSVAGTLRCWCTRDLATKLAANLLAVEPHEGEAQIGAEDALREFMNVLCGQLVTSWYGTAGVFNLSIPTVREGIGGPSADEADGKPLCQLSIEGQPLFCLCQQHC